MPDANLPDLNNLEAEVNEIIIPKKFPHITIATINCNSLNMATVAKHVRLRKFYGIVSLKTDIILLSDIRMCNKAGYCDMNFISKTFSVNPYSSYNFFHHSRTNKRGVGILVKKSIPFTYLGRETDPDDDNYILLLASIHGETVIIGSVYGPNLGNANFFGNLCASLRNLGEYPTVMAGDWNATYSCLPLAANPDVMNMQDVPNIAHSRHIREVCNEFKLTDPFRVLYPNKVDFSYAPWGNIRDNRSRIDFFIVSKSIVNSVFDCYIKNAP
jgi:exonuclease III